MGGRLSTYTDVFVTIIDTSVIFRSRSNPFPLSLSRQRENLNATELVATSHVDYTTSLESIQAVYLSR
eukprot:1350340-Amorphochlora_amoeboformis.AAC.1